ncbi:MAG: DUF4394 domain-containing protein [bacterium]|nr:DUF4394 domain-containing protein [bacterium]
MLLKLLRGPRNWPNVGVLVLVGVLAGSTAQAEIIYGVTEVGNRLVSFDSAAPTALLSGAAITGLAPGEDVIGIDFRPNALSPGGGGPNVPAPGTGTLFGLGSQSNLYTIDLATGAATRVGDGFDTPSLNGGAFSFDFNPTIDRIRNVADTNVNIVLNPNSGDSGRFTDVFYQAGDDNAGVDPNIVHSAYTNSFVGSTSTQLYGIDSGLDVLVTQANNAGTLATVGPLGGDVTSLGGFDISGSTGIAYLVALVDGDNDSTLWTVDLATGGASFVNFTPDASAIGGGTTLAAIAVIPEPSTALLLGLGLGGLGIARRTREG